MKAYSRGQTFAFVGISGSGKGTQAKLLINHLKKNGCKDILYIYTGDLFRSLSKQKFLAGRIIKDDLANGRLPAEWIASYLWEAKLVKELKNAETTIIFDGSPRRIREIKDMEEVLGWFNREKLYLIYLKLSRKSASSRLKSRGREDDTDANINQRINWFYESVEPIISRFKAEDPEHLIELDGEKTIAAIHEDLKSFLK